MKKTKIKTVNISKLKNAKYNPRQINDESLAGLTASIEEFGCVAPIIWNEKTGNVVGGHQRLKVLRLKKAKEVDVVIVNLSLKKEKALNVALNNRHIQGDWTGKLELLLEEIMVEEEDLFKNLKLDLLVDDIPLTTNLGGPGKTNPDKVPETPKISVIKDGDLIALSNHRILCGDSTKKEDVERLMVGEKADMVFTDPPYGINLDTNYTGIMGRGKEYKRVEGDNKKFNPSHIFSFFDCKEVFLWGANYYADLLPDLLGCGWFVWDKQHSDEDGKSHTGNFFELCWSKEKHKYQVIKKEWFRFYGLATQDTKKRIPNTKTD